ncbi:MAG TPA: HAMP domain-containing sensor histidine kinase, partial [Nitrososphaeraceae archaeon]|nr:HAMP domain-containing sensor histidine kinase [Nitrososphaeraceae archaeon]
LARANEQLELKTSEQNASNKALFESNRELAQVNKEIAETNKRFALTNKQFALTNKQFIELSKELTAVNKELALAYQTIEKQNKIHIEFINIAAHELRTPIQPILGTAELLKNEIEEATYNDRQDRNNNNGIQVEQIKSRIEVIIRNAKRLKELASNILDVSRIESQLLVLNKEQFNLEEVISSIISVYNESSQKEKKLLVELEGDRNIIVKADKDKIAQVISNLLNNAVKFTKDEPEGTISISSQRKDDDDDDNNNDYVLVSVKDTGKGIDNKIFPRLFSKFITTTSKSSTDGIGIGLFVSKAIVEAHGGKIWAENNSDGKGAAFAFSLPID